MKRMGLIVALAALAGWLVPEASAQQQQQRQRQYQAQQQQRNNVGTARQQSQQLTGVAGNLIDMRLVNLKGERDQHVLAKLRTPQGKTVIVDLGERRHLRGQRFKKDQPLLVIGRVGRISGKPILAADQIRDPSRPEAVLQIVRVAPQNAARQQTARANQGARQRSARAFQQAPNLPAWHPDVRTAGMRMVNGRIIDKREVQLRGQQQRHLLVKVRTPQNQTALINLGPSRNQALQDIKLQQGEYISAIGRVGRISGKPALMAQHVADIVTLEWLRQNQQQSGQARQASQTTQGQRQQSGNNRNRTQQNQGGQSY